MKDNMKNDLNMNSTNNTINGIILKGIGGFYYVEAADKVYECKARGVFRKEGISPCAGDRVEISIPEEGYVSIDTIFPRKNSLVRPAVANIDTLMVVISTCKPQPNFFVADKMTALAVKKDIRPIIVISKNDLRNGSEIAQRFKETGFKTLLFSKEESESIEEIKSVFCGKITVLSGNTGVGKSTLLNNIFPELNLETGEISEKLGRGKHTTRAAQLYRINGGYVVDTPGFSTVDMNRYEIIKKDELAFCFPEFEGYIDNCAFTSCSHTTEKGCAVLEALNSGKINPSRFESYRMMYDEVKDLKEWQLK